jgi:4-hydroxybenzoate polyprenyltransferase
MSKTFAEKQVSRPVRADKPTASGAKATFKDWCELIKVEHTVFALPFALSGLVLASDRIPGLTLFFWTATAFAGARAAAMSLNRVIDAEIDRKNKRTSERAIPKGMISRRSATLLAIFSFLIMIFAATQLPPLCLKLSPIAVLWLSLYSFTKRFTWLCHFALGIALGGAALGGWLAAGGSIGSQPAWILALAVTTWVSGFDIIYACLDWEFDRQEKLLSLPAVFGIKNALAVSSALHVVTVLALIYLGHLLALGLWYWLGIALAAAALFFEHSLVSPDDLSKANQAFFNVNGLVSILVFSAILTDRLLKH